MVVIGFFLAVGFVLLALVQDKLFTPEEQKEIDKFCAKYDIKPVQRGGGGRVGRAMAAAANKQNEAIKTRLVNWVDSNGATMLHHASDEWGVAVVKYLISEGASVDAKDNDGDTPLHLAAINDNIEVVKLLVSKKANVNAKNNDGETPLDYAKITNNTAIVDYLSSL
jgi:hypothetical protein